MFLRVDYSAKRLQGFLWSIGLGFLDRFFRHSTLSGGLTVHLHKKDLGVFLYEEFHEESLGSKVLLGFLLVL